MVVPVEELTRASLLLATVGKPASNVNMPTTNAAPPAATVATVAERSLISVSRVATTITGLVDQVPCSASSISSSATPNATSPPTSPPASWSTRIRSVTWRSLRISEVVTVFGLAASEDEVSRIALKAGFGGVTPKAVSRTFEILTRLVDCKAIGWLPFARG
jgi:hypothetical protein